LTVDRVDTYHYKAKEHEGDIPVYYLKEK
jgi:hypothetical protein